MRFDDPSLESRARRRVSLKMGLYVHALVFVLVNAGLFLLDRADGARPSPISHVWPLWWWGLGLAIHAAVTWATLSGDGLRERMLAREIEILKRREQR